MKNLVNGDNRIEVRPPILVLVMAMAAIIASFAMALWSISRIDQFTVVGFIVMPCAILIAFIFGVDALQRKFVFSKDKIEVRFLFYRKANDIRGNVEIISSKSGQVVIRDGRDGGQILRIPREYNHSEILEERLREFYLG